MYPCELKNFREKLEGQDNVVKVNDYLINHDIEFSIKLRQFRSIIDNGYFNPYREYQLEKYYVKTESFDKLDMIFNFKNYVDLKCNLIHIGEKGSGKTALQNCWLYENKDRLEDNRIFWVRCDAHKLYNLWLEFEEDFDKEQSIKEHMERQESEDYSENENELGSTEGSITNRLVDIEQYLDIQLLYVFSKYAFNEQRNFLKNIVAQIKRENPEFEMSNSRNTNSKRTEKLYERIQDLNDIILKEEHAKYSGYSYAYDHVMKNSLHFQQLEKRKWIDTSLALQKFLAEHDYWLLKIVDGVDNVHINNEGSVKFYKHMLRGCYDFMKRRPQEKHLHFIALREKSLADIKTNQIGIEGGNGASFEESRVINKPASVNEVFRKRFVYAFDSLIQDGGIFRSIAQEVLEEKKEECNNYYHNNLRSYLYNKASLIALAYYRIKQLGIHNASIKSQVDNLSKRNRFLNGSLFLNTRRYWGDINLERGVCMMNIFYFDIDEYNCHDGDNWYGFCQTRILQLLMRKNQLTEANIKKCLKHTFGYPEKLLSKMIANLRAFGQIDSHATEDKQMVLTISEKGRHDLSFSYRDIDTLYYFSLDTPVPLKMVNEGMFCAHNNKFSGKTHYPYSSIICAINFLSFLLDRNKYERDKAPEKSPEESIDFGDITLPHWSTEEEASNAIVDSFYDAFQTAKNDSDLEEIQKFEKRIDQIM